MVWSLVLIQASMAETERPPGTIKARQDARRQAVPPRSLLPTASRCPRAFGVVTRASTGHTVASRRLSVAVRVQGPGLSSNQTLDLASPRGITHVRTPSLFFLFLLLDHCFQNISLSSVVFVLLTKQINTSAVNFVPIAPKIKVESREDSNNGIPEGNNPRTPNLSLNPPF